MTKRIMWEIRYYLSGFQFYRGLKGGTWFYVRPRYDFSVYGTYWINRSPLNNEMVIKTEVH